MKAAAEGWCNRRPFMVPKTCRWCNGPMRVIRPKNVAIVVCVTCDMPGLKSGRRTR